MAWFLRAIELVDGQWACRWSDVEYDRHDDLWLALAHLRVLAQEIGPVTYFVHHVDGRVTEIAD